MSTFFKYPNLAWITLDPLVYLYHIKLTFDVLFSSFILNTLSNLGKLSNLRAIIDLIHPVHLFDIRINPINWLIIHIL